MQTIGRLEVIVGSMFSGKSEELLRRLRRAVIARQHVQVFKPAIDNRYSETKVASHAGNFLMRRLSTALMIFSACLGMTQRLSASMKCSFWMKRLSELLNRWPTGASG